MTNALPTQEIERILEACMPAYHAHCSRGADGTFAFQFQSRLKPGAFAIVGIRVEDCRGAQQVRRLGKQFLEDLALATESRDASRPLQDATQRPSQSASQG